MRPGSIHNVNPGSSGVCFQAVHDCWATNIEVVNPDLAFGLTAAKSCTLSGISSSGRALHHFVACRTASHDNLIQDFVQQPFTTQIAAGAYHYGINLEGLSSGNVYRRGTLPNGTFDSHRALPLENLRTNITLTNEDAVLGGSFDAGRYFGARTVHWGITPADGNNLGVEISNVAPRSLTVGITGLAQPGSGGLATPFLKRTFSGDLEAGPRRGRGSSAVLRDFADLGSGAGDRKLQDVDAPRPASAARRPLRIWSPNGLMGEIDRLELNR